MLTRYSPLCAFLIAPRSHMASSFSTIVFQPWTCRFYPLWVIACCSTFIGMLSSSFTAWRVLLVNHSVFGCCLPFVIYCICLSAVNCLLNAVCCLPSIVYRIRVVDCCLRACVCDTYRVKALTVFAVNCLPLTIYCSMSADDR